MSSPHRPQRIRVYQYEFEAHVTHCKVKVNFPCTFFLSWNTGTAEAYSGSRTIEDGQVVKAIEDTIPFNSRLLLTLEIPYDEGSKSFYEKKVVSEK